MRQQVHDLLKVDTEALQVAATAPLPSSKAVMVLLHRAGTVDHRGAMANNSPVVTVNSQVVMANSLADTAHHHLDSLADMDGPLKVVLHRAAIHHSKVDTVLLHPQDIRTLTV